MSINASLPWTYSLEQASRVQENLSKRLNLSWDNRPVRTIAGIDTTDSGVIIHAAVSVVSFPELARVAVVSGESTQGFPYISGMLAFRIGPAILEAWEKLKLKPDLVIIHGQGTAHPRGFGLAAHIGLWLNIPTIGVAKTRLYGKYNEVGPNAGDWSELRDEYNPKLVIGAALRTQPEVKPIFVSPGQLIDLPHSIEFVMACIRSYRMPEPLRLAQAAADKSNHQQGNLATPA